MTRYTVAVLVNNKSGVLNRVTSMFRRRQFNISALTVSETESNKFSRITVVFDGDESSKQQLINQLYKLVDVYSISELDGTNSVSRELLLIKLAKEVGLFTVQRFFLVDSHSVETILETIKSVKPDMAEVMPGVVPKVIADLKEKVTIPVIAGGLIDSRDEIKLALQSGAAAVSIGKKEFWGVM